MDCQFHSEHQRQRHQFCILQATPSTCAFQNHLHSSVTMDKLVCIDDIEKEALQKLGQNAKEYFTSGADDELTIKDNLESYSRILIRPRMLRDVSNRKLSTTILGKPVQVPIGISSCAMQGLAHPEAELGSAKAVEEVGGVMVLSVFANSSYDEVAKVAPTARKWVQFYMHKDRSITKSIVGRAEKAGFEAMVFTIDAQYLGKRRVSVRNPIRFPPHLRFPNASPGDMSEDISIYRMHDDLDFEVTWEAVEWLKKNFRLPLIVKGVQTAEDAVRAVELGVDAIWVSNHGGRQVDTAPASIDILPSIVRAVNGRANVFVDGGVRRGADVYKALALGADFVFIGRPAIWGLAVDGSKGVKKVLEILRDELDLTMALTGVPDIKSITRDCVCRREDLSKL